MVGREKEWVISMLKVIEVLAESDKSFDDAAQVAIFEAAKSLRNIRSIYIKEMTALVENDQLVRYRINAKISFLLDDESGGGLLENRAEED